MLVIVLARTDSLGASLRKMVSVPGFAAEANCCSMDRLILADKDYI